MRKIKLTNDFHNTSVNLNVDVDYYGDGKLSSRQVARSRARLCGCKGCECSGYVGVRGYQHYVSAIETVIDADGTITANIHLRGY